MASKSVSLRLHGLLENLQAVSDPKKNPLNKSAGLALLKTWQSERLGKSFAALRTHPRFGLAAEFFLSDLYGAGDVTWRDRDVSRIMPVMTRWLPDSVLLTLAEALELDLLSREFDIEMARALKGAKLDAARYGAAYRAVGDAVNRRRQVALIRIVGEELERIVRKPFVLGVLKLARGPARGAGLAGLQAFLERGFAAFRHMGPAREFLDTIVQGEEKIMQRLFAAHPDPFGFDHSQD
ncbi:MAG: hypothetical protein SGI99_07560 [Pseudomonadota bacterium]|nr:hypothetical protein [Pseudomonadota bacterium]